MITTCFIFSHFNTNVCVVSTLSLWAWGVKWLSCPWSRFWGVTLLQHPNISFVFPQDTQIKLSSNLTILPSFRMSDFQCLKVHSKQHDMPQENTLRGRISNLRNQVHQPFALSEISNLLAQAIDYLWDHPKSSSKSFQAYVVSWQGPLLILLNWVSVWR